MVDAGKIAGLILFSSLKFFLAPSATVVAGYSFWETIFITCSGGVLGFLVFFKFGSYISAKIQSFFKSKREIGISKKSRRIVNLKNKYGLYGLAILTPCLLSIPLGAFIASAYYSKDKRTIPVFLGFIVIWSFILTLISTLVI